MKTEGIEDYTQLASDYDELRYNSLQQLFLDTLRFQAVHKCLEPSNSMTIIDVGTGTGSGIIYFARLVKKMVGLDGTEAMLDRAREKIISSEIANVELVYANALKIPFADETFDNVISLNFIHLFVPFGIDKQKEFISEMERVCKIGGKVIVEFDNAIFLELGNKYSDFAKMSSRMTLQNVVGLYLPKTESLYNKSIAMAKCYSKIANAPFIKRLAYKWVVQFRKV